MKSATHRRPVAVQTSVPVAISGQTRPRSELRVITTQDRPLESARASLKEPLVVAAEDIELQARHSAATRKAGHDQANLNVPGRSLRHPSSTPGRSSSILHRFTSLRAPIAPLSSRISSRRTRGKHYDTLEEQEGDDDCVPVDLSSLAGLGYRLEEVESETRKSTNPSQNGATDGREQHPTTVQVAENRNPGHRLGKGMVLGVQLKPDPASVTIQRGSSSRLTPRDRSEEGISRAKSIREIGQHLAQERQVIVAVNEPADITSFEGPQLQHIDSDTYLDAMESTHKPASGALQSYFYPEDPERPDWKPFTMRSFYILLLIVVSLTLAGVQEWFCQRSMRLAAAGSGILEFNQVSSVTVGNFFIWKYSPTLIFVAYGVLWQIMDYDIKRLEPFYQLSQTAGSTAAASLNLDHTTAWAYFVPIKALKLRQWAVFISSIGNILATTISPSLQNPTVALVQNPKCDANNVCPANQNLYFVRISPPWSRALSTALIVTAILGAILFVQLRRKSGLLSDPKGVAGIASMATKSHILNDFQGMDLATRGQIHKRLQHRRFVLYKSTIWQGEWNRQTQPWQESVRKGQSTHPLMLRLEAGIPLMLFMGLCLISIPIINFTEARSIPNAVPWLPVLLASLIKVFWTTFESDARLMEPFYILSKGNAAPQESITLDYQGTPYGWFPIKALLKRHFLLALVGASSIALDVLTVTVASFSVNSEAFLHTSGATGTGEISNQDQTFVSFWTSVIFSMAILVFVILSATLVYARRRHPFLPREPSTIAAVLAFIYASKMLDDFIDTERYSNREMEAMLKAKGKTYGLGWFKGRDGKMHCAIDEEPMRSRYVHGKPYTLAQSPWEGGHDHGLV